MDRMKFEWHTSIKRAVTGALLVCALIIFASTSDAQDCGGSQLPSGPSSDDGESRRPAAKPPLPDATPRGSNSGSGSSLKGKPSPNSPQGGASPKDKKDGPKG